MGADDDDDIPATQPILPFLLEDVVAYVEVRSGHDNRSRGVKTQLRNLGATIVDNLTNNVTHVIFNEGLPSTYKKAKKFNCHLVSVLWIEACKQELTKVSEAGYPPIGQEIYENPQSLKNFKKLKSMQPDFDEEEDERKTNQVLKRIKRRQAKPAIQNKTSAETNHIMLPPRTMPKSKAPPKNCAEKTRKGRVKSKDSQKKDALKEITPDIINKPLAPDSMPVSSVPEAAVSAESFNIIRTASDTSSSQSSVSSTSSVIFCGEVKETGSSQNQHKKTTKHHGNTSVSRVDFMEGLNDIMLCLSQEKESRIIETSPWRRNLYRNTPDKYNEVVSSNKVSPRRSPRHTLSTSNSHISPRRSPRHAKRQENENKKSNKVSKPAGFLTASAAIRKHRAPLPSSPNDDFVLLSQEPGDMPSVDEMAKMRKGSIHAGDERITLSQIVRSYNAVAERYGNGSKLNSESSSTTCDELTEQCENVEECPSTDQFIVSVDRNSRHSNQEVSVVDVEDVGDVRDTEVSKNFGNSCPSDSDSTVSSVGVKVLIDGKSQDMENKNTSSSVLLPDSEGMDLEQTAFCTVDQEKPSLEEGSTVEEYERDPSPVFIIKKAKFKRPLKKQLSRSNQQRGIKHSFTLSNDNEDTSARNNGNEGSSNVLSASMPSEKSRQSLSPVDYINKLLPKFSIIGNRTPMNFEDCDVIAEDTPEVPSSSTCEISSIVIPPTPLENEGKYLEDVTLEKSLSKPVISWFKKGCKVPLFSSRSSKTPQTDLNSKNTNRRNVVNDVPDLLPDEFAQDFGSSLKSSELIAAVTPPELGNRQTFTGRTISNLSGASKSKGLSPRSDSEDLKPLHSSSRQTIQTKVTPKGGMQKGSVGVLKSEHSSVRRSPRNQQALSPAVEANQGSQERTDGDDGIVKEENSKDKPAEKKKASSTRKSQRSKGRVVVTVITDDVDNKRDGKKQRVTLGISSLCPASLVYPPRTEDGHSSSGYETSSQSEINPSNNKARKETSENESTMPFSNQLKPNNFLAPVSAAPKKRSEIYEGDSSSRSPVGHKKDVEKAFIPEQPRRKRNQVVPELESSKKQKLDKDETSSTGSRRTTRISRADSRSLSGTRSHSDLSVDSMKISARKSSQEAKKRMAKSATRTYTSSDPKVIVCTFLTASEQNGVEAAGENLDGWKMEGKVTSRTTHVVNSGPKRTINMLKGMVRGCWLVDQKWMLQSSKKGAWLDEENFELETFSPAVRQCRLRRQALGKEFKHTLFAQTGPIYVSPKTEGPPAKDLREMLELSGADVRTSLQDAQIVIGSEPSHKGRFQCVQALWVLDCITKNKILSLNDAAYKIK